MAAPPDDDMLREAARARGFRLVKSRRRKPGGDFGRYGLVGLDSGRERLGFSPDGLTATADEVHAYLRGGELAAWKRSLIGVVGPDTAPPAHPKRGREKPGGAQKEERATPSSPAKARREASPVQGKPSDPPVKSSKRSPPRSSPRLRGGAGGVSSAPSSRPVPVPVPAPVPAPAPAPKPPPTLTIREATRGDAAALARILDLPAATLAERLSAALRADEPPLVADRDGPVGVAAWTIVPTLQDGLRGLVTSLSVAPDERREDVAARLTAAVEQRLHDAGITFVDLASGVEPPGG